MFRIGLGQDSHRFSQDPTRKLVLGGVYIADVAGLDGNSDADVVLHDGEAKRLSVYVDDGKIASFDATAADEEIDLTGATLLPGFIDVHIHGAVGIDVMDATTGDLRKVSASLASQGVTSWLPTFVPASDENYASAVAAISDAMSGPGARVLGLRVPARR